MRRSGRASQGRYPGLAILACLCWLLAAAPAVAQDQDPVVTSATPPAAEQGSVNLDVVIGGKNFKKGAVARFLVTGTEDPGGITVNATTFKGSTQLIANITVADAAALSKFDIEVVNTSGRRGKGIELFSVVEKGKLSTGGSGSLVRSEFRNNGDDGLRSDGQHFPCGFDYVDKSDPCAATMEEQASLSQESTGSLYWLRTVPACCIPPVNSGGLGWEAYVASPSRWLVLDFSQPELRADGTASPCPNIDSLVAQRVSDVTGAVKNWEYYGLPTPVPPPADEDTTSTFGRCVDNVSVRFRGARFLSGGGAGPSLTIDIDEPQLVGTTPNRKGTSSPGIQWNTVYRLVFRGPLMGTTSAGVTTVQTTGGESELADLFDAQDNYVGTYRMRFLLEMRPAQ